MSCHRRDRLVRPSTAAPLNDNATTTNEQQQQRNTNILDSLQELQNTINNSVMRKLESHAKKMEAIQEENTSLQSMIRTTIVPQIAVLTSEIVDEMQRQEERNEELSLELARLEEEKIEAAERNKRETSRAVARRESELVAAHSRERARLQDELKASRRRVEELSLNGGRGSASVESRPDEPATIEATEQTVVLQAQEQAEKARQQLLQIQKIHQNALVAARQRDDDISSRQSRTENPAASSKSSASAGAAASAPTNGLASAAMDAATATTNNHATSTSPDAAAASTLNNRATMPPPSRTKAASPVTPDNRGTKAAASDTTNNHAAAAASGVSAATAPNNRTAMPLVSRKKAVVPNNDSSKAASATPKPSLSLTMIGRSVGSSQTEKKTKQKKKKTAPTEVEKQKQEQEQIRQRKQDALASDTERERKRVIKKEKEEALAVSAATQSNSKASKQQLTGDGNHVSSNHSNTMMEHESHRIGTAESVTRLPGLASAAPVGIDDGERSKKPLLSDHKPPPAAAAASLSLSRYLFAPDGHPTTISPIFGMLQNPETRHDARQLLQLESDMIVLKRKLGQLEKSKSLVEGSIASEHKLEVQYNKRLDRIEKEYKQMERKWGAFNLKLGWWEKEEDEYAASEEEEEQDESNSQDPDSAIRKMREKNRAQEAKKRSRASRANRLRELGAEAERVKKLRDEIGPRLLTLSEELTKMDEPIAAELEKISKLRDKISKIKGEGQKEEKHFHIDDNRDEHGFTFLMVAAQNNDLDTARLCLGLNANPNATTTKGHTAMLFAFYFGLNDMVSLIAKYRGIFPQQQANVWDKVKSTPAMKDDSVVDWETTLRIAEQAAIPTERIMESAAALEMSDDSRMAHLTARDRHEQHSVYFKASLADPDTNNVRRVVLLEEAVYTWFRGSEVTLRSYFLSFLRSLNPAEHAQQAVCTRRAVVGIEKTYEVLCAPLRNGSTTDVALFSPFVTSAVDGVTDVGVLVWAVTPDNKASLFKTLIESTDFLRHKVEYDEHFLPHKRNVLELGRDMHLLDLRSTSIHTSKPMGLFVLDVDEGDLNRLGRNGFVPKKRIAYYEHQLNKALSMSEEETKDAEAILATGSRGSISTSLVGGAGTGKTLLMVKKVTSVSPERRILVLSRLSRLVIEMKCAIETKRDAANVTFVTYDDFLARLVRSVSPPTYSERCSFSAFTQVQFGTAGGGGSAPYVSFEDDFVRGYLGVKQRKAMEDEVIKPITLWTAFRTIKSNARCAQTKEPLSREDYLALPSSFGLRDNQRKLVYDLFERYMQWLGSGSTKWDEADRVLYILKFGPSVFADREFLSWEERAYRRGEIELLDEDGESPLAPFFYEMVFADEAQDFTELDLALFLRMSGGIGSVFLGSDPAQSVEVGIRMRAGTINDVFHSSLSSNKKGIQVKSVLQEMQMQRNHRTHAQNLAIANAVRKILARSFGILESKEHALINGPIPEGLSLAKIRDLADAQKFAGGNIVFLAPDETANELRRMLGKWGIKNDVFGVREAKGLEFDDVALVGFFSFIDQLGNGREWENVLRWLSSATGTTTTESSEKIHGRRLVSCDYTLSHPEVLDQAMLLYTALTRARNHLYVIEIEELGKAKKRQGLEDFAFRVLTDLNLMKIVKAIDQGFVEMTPQQHKARGVLLVTQAINLSRSAGAKAQTTAIQEKFLEAADRFRPDKGNDKELLDKCLKQMEAVLLKRSLIETIKRKFVDPHSGLYDLNGCFDEILLFEVECSKFFSTCVGDTFLAGEIGEMRGLLQDLFRDTPYEARFGDICSTIMQHEP